MTEKITIKVPDGTKEKLQDTVLGSDYPTLSAFIREATEEKVQRDYGTDYDLDTARPGRPGQDAR
jgi:Arc/MetJ-type ribon-helix-helix transcriptional regulator